MIPQMVECDFCQQRKHETEAEGWIMIAGNSLQFSVFKKGETVAERKFWWVENSPVHFCSIPCLETFFRSYQERHK